MQPMPVLATTFTGNEPPEDKVVKSDGFTKVIEGKKRTNRSLLRILKVAFGMSWTFGWERIKPYSVIERSFSRGNTASLTSSCPEIMFSQFLCF